MAQSEFSAANQKYMDMLEDYSHNDEEVKSSYLDKTLSAVEEFEYE